MLYHKPFGWVLDKEHNERFNINSIGGTGVGGYTYKAVLSDDTEVEFALYKFKKYCKRILK